jgi:hypothetical protein
VNLNGLKSVPKCLPDMVCMTGNDITASPHTSGKTKSQQKANKRKDSLPIWVKLPTTSGRRDHRNFGRSHDTHFNRLS